jgi:hypothetical protein
MATGPKWAKIKKKKRTGPSSRDFIDNKDLLAEIRKSKARMAEHPELGQAALTPRLATMLVKLVDRYATNSSWSGYSYVDEFKGEAVLNLYQKWHKFDDVNYDNPFAFYTQVMYHCFLSALSREKKQQKIKDLVLETQGKMPSFGRQMEHEEENNNKIATSVQQETINENDDPNDEG